MAVSSLTFVRKYQSFFLLWLGQFVSGIGTTMTRFGLLIWAYQQSGSATALALLGASSYLSYTLTSPFAGVVVDRLDRRIVMVLADLGSAVCTAALLALFLAGGLQIWHLYLFELLTGIFDAFQEPANTAVVTLLVPAEQYGRASGFQSMGWNGAKVLAPALAGVLLAVWDLEVVMIIDLVTFMICMGLLLVIRVPRPPVSDAGREAAGHFVAELRYGFRYIIKRPGLRGLMMTFVAVNFFASITYFGVVSAMILARSNGDEMVLGMVQMVMGIGGIVGGLIFSAWGGAKNKAVGYLSNLAASYFFGDMMFALGSSPLVLALGGLGSTIFIPMLCGYYFAIWQTRVPADVQGRVLAARNMMQTALMPVGYILGGVLADVVFEPAMAGGGALAGVFGPLLGTGPGAGMGLMFLLTCVIGLLICLFGYLNPAVRNVEQEE